MSLEKQNRQEPSLVRIRGAKKPAFQARADLEAKDILSRRTDRTACLFSLFKMSIGWKQRAVEERKMRYISQEGQF